MPFCLECLMAVLRRFMISLMSTGTMTTIAVILTGLEEVLLRTTIAHRDDAYRKYMMKKFRKRTPREKMIQNVVWMTSINNQMIAEMIAIVSRVSVVVLLSKFENIFSFSLKSGTAATHSSIVFFNVCLELIFEIIVDILAVTAELQEGISVDLFFRYFRNTSVVGFHASGAILAVFSSVYMMVSTPTVFFCDSMKDICSCRHHVYPQYTQACENSTAYVEMWNASLADKKSDLERLSSDEIRTLLLGFVSFFAALVTLSLIQVWRSRRRDRVRIESTQAQLDSKLRLIKKLRNEFGTEMQRKVSEHLKGAKKQLAPYVVPHDHLVLKTKIGQGAYGEVWKGLYRGTPVAVKRAIPVEINRYVIQKFREECVLMATLQRNKGMSHPNLVQMLHCCWENEMLIVLEFCQMGSLDAVLTGAAEGKSGILKYMTWSTKIVDPEPFSGETEASDDCLLNWALQICSGMNFIHSQSPPVLHRDLKPDNVLISGEDASHPKHWRAKICDFGSSRLISETPSVPDLTHANMTMAGTPLFMAPEVLRCEGYDLRADVYSYGMLLLDMASFQVGGLGKCWEISESGKFMIAHVCYGARPGIPDDIIQHDPWLTRIVKKCWEPDKSKRPQTFAEVANMLVHRTSHLPAELRGASMHSETGTGFTPKANMSRRLSSSKQLYYNDPELLKELSELRDKVTRMEEDEELDDFRALIGIAQQ